ncbi:MAG: hypothetical protein J5802_13965 [Butyrivibrio sp.]|nr:hypothetical protein [Butyrivibrio sp.]
MNDIQLYNIMAIISVVTAFIMLILAIVMWFKLDIRHYIAVLTGSEARKSIESLQKSAEAGNIHADVYGKNNKAKISWNTSEGLARVAAMEISDEDGTVMLAATGTMMRDDSTTVLQSSEDYATTVLDAIKESEFVVEREIVNRGDERL